jgi:hypothetical protein
LVLFPALCIMAVMRRWPWRYFVALVVSTVLMAIIYSKVLPGADRIGAIPWGHLSEGAQFGLSWLSNAIYSAWLRMGDWEAGRAAYVAYITPHAGWVAGSAMSFARGENLPTFSLTITRNLSVLSVIVAAGIFGYHLRKPFRSPLQFFSVALLIFVAGTGLLIVLFRVAYFIQNPTQVLVDRYVPWSCLWWLALALYAVSSDAFARKKYLQWTGVILAFMLAWGLSFTQVTGGMWAAISAQRLEMFALTQRLGIEDVTMMQGYGIDSLDRTRATTLLLRNRGLAMFAKPLPFALASVAPEAGGEGFSTRFDPSEWANTLPGATRGIHFSGSLPNTALTKQIATMIAVDQNGRMAGLAKRTWIGDRLGAHWDIGLERKIGIDGYVVVTNPTDNFSLRVQLKDGTWLDGGVIPGPPKT